MEINIDLTTGSKFLKFISVLSCILTAVCVVFYLAYDEEVISYEVLLFLFALSVWVDVCKHFKSKKPE